MLKDTFLRKIPPQVLFKLLEHEAKSKLTKEKMFVRYLALALNTPSSYLFKLLPKMEELGLIRTERVGRRRYIYLTETGRELGLALKEVFESTTTR